MTDSTSNTAAASPPHRFRCDTCHETNDGSHGDTVGNVHGETIVRCPVHRCGGECERVNYCARCRTIEADDSCDFCLECISDDVVADPAAFDDLVGECRTRVAKILARRLRPKLTVRQAA